MQSKSSGVRHRREKMKNWEHRSAVKTINATIDVYFIYKPLFDTNFIRCFQMLITPTLSLSQPLDSVGDINLTYSVLFIQTETQNLKVVMSQFEIKPFTSNEMCVFFMIRVLNPVLI